jgi:hypothetical protein
MTIQIASKKLLTNKSPKDGKQADPAKYSGLKKSS